MIKLMLITIFLCILSATVSAKVVGTTTYKGKTYYVDVLPSGASAAIWLRVNSNSCTSNDINVLKLIVSNPTLKSAGTTICRAKNYYDNGKTIAGCLSVAASGACAAATVATEGAAAVFCSATFTYTIEKGAADCIDGISNKIADYLGADPWASYATRAGLTKFKLQSVIDIAIDNACKDLKK